MTTLPRRPARRTVLQAGAVGAATVSALSVRGFTSPSAEAALARATGCATLTPELTQGPFWVDELLHRADIRADSETGAVQSGIPLTLTVNLQDAGASCAPQAGAYVDIWHANAQGAYSDVSGSGNPNNVGVDWLRGYQVSDAKGAVTFTTIFPGWYTGRTIHIHFRIRLSLDSSTTVNFTSQLFFEEAVDAAVASSSGYTKSGTRTTNSTDDIYVSSMVVPVTGSTSTGYTGAFTVNLDFGDGSTSTSSSASSTAGLVAAHVTGARVVRRLGRRVVVVDLASTEKVTARLRVVRHDDVLAKRTFGWMRRGKHQLTLRLPRDLSAGRAKILLQISDRAGNTKIVKRQLQLPAQ